MEKTIVLGIGNILMRDEGFGVRVIEEFTRSYAFPDSVEVLDGGTLGMELLRFINGAGRLLIIDAINGGDAPGAFYQFAGDQVKAYFRHKVSMHELGIQDVLAALELLGQPVEEIVVMGVQPAVIDIGLELSDTVLPAVTTTVEAALDVLRTWGINCLPHT
ncbi:Hydrogenase 2 maturation protease [Sporomusa carbonis]|uniref:HyaD/HybD family hydrogenase maturation endopeptidase n=1 Tax=Sporomusa carbonis TaxID=3076075 RepID=UPI003A637401